jgi:hypothetical protein
MSEKGWLEGLEPGPMLDFLAGRMSARKLRLLACAACRTVWDSLVDDRSRNAVIVAERFADGQASQEELEAAHRQASSAFGDLGMAGGHVSSAAAAVHNACWYKQDFAVTARRSLACAVGVGVSHAARDVDSGKMSHVPNWESLVYKRENGKMARLMREMFGNPFKTLTREPACIAPAVAKLARGIYEDRAFDQLPQLAGLLEENGLSSKTVLAHCREQKPHYRGCWVVDWVMGDEPLMQDCRAQEPV